MRLLGNVKTKWKIFFSIVWDLLRISELYHMRHFIISVYKNLVQYAYYSFCLLETFEEFLSKNTISSHISFSMWPRATFYDILLQNIQVETRSVNIGKDSKFAIFEKKEKSKMLMNCFVHPIFSSFGFWYFGHFSCVIFFLVFSVLPILPCKM